MSSISAKKSLYYFARPNRWQRGIGAELPEAYKKFWNEWKVQEPTAVHYVKEEGNWKFDEETGVPQRVRNIPLPSLHPKEMNEGIWGGEVVIQGFRKKSDKLAPVAKFWVPRLIRSVVYSEVLNKHMITTITRRTIELIHANYGFDHYLLKTPACDLKSELALSLKRKILIALADKTLYPNDPEKREEVYERYKEYLTAYTREEIEWYGLSWLEACKKHYLEKEASIVIEPLKVKYRAELIEKLKNNDTATKETDESESKSWLSKVNPFSKNQKS